MGVQQCHSSNLPLPLAVRRIPCDLYDTPDLMPFIFIGMCAFGIIIGDTIPQVLRYIFPTLPTIPVLSLFTNRQFVIAFCTICVSYPLSLYRDIHKLARASGLALIGMLIVVVAVAVEGPRVPANLKGNPDQRFTIISPGFFQAVGVISFAFGKPLSTISRYDVMD